MALPNIFRKLFKSNGYGPLLKDEIVSKHISVQDWSNAFDYPVATVARGADGILYYSVAQSGPNVGGAQDPTTDNGTYWQAMPMDNANVVHKTGNETINGSKVFINDIDIRNNEPALNARNTNYTRKSTPSDNSAGWGINFSDSSGGVQSYLRSFVYSTRSSDIFIGTYSGVNDNDIAVLLRYEGGGDFFFAPSTNGTCYCGVAAYRWKQFYATTATIGTSDERLKSSISSIPDEVLDAWGSVGFVQFQFNEAVEKKGATTARLHSGLVAQRIDEAFKARGLDASRYGLFCYDQWGAQEEVRGKDGNVFVHGREAGDCYSLRYEEALCMEAAYQRRRADRAEARLAALEERLAAIEAKLG